MSDTLPAFRLDEMPTPEYATEIIFEGTRCGVIAPEDYAAMYARIAELEAALADAIKRAEAAEKDAERYRWLKINARRIDFAGLCVSDGAQLDARIDAAIRAEAK